MEEASLSDLIKRMKEEGNLLRNSGANSIKSLKTLQVELSGDLVQQIRESMENITVKTEAPEPTPNTPAPTIETATEKKEEGEVTPPKVFADLTDKIESRLQELNQQKSLEDLGEKIKGLQGGLLTTASANAEELKAEFERVRGVLTSDEVTDEERDNAREQLKALEDLAGSEEEAREKEEASGMLGRGLLALENTLGNLEKTLEGIVDGMAGAAVGIGLGLLLFNPELFLDIVLGAVEFFEKLFRGVAAIFEGDLGPITEVIQEHTLAFAATLAFIAIKFGLLTKIAKGISFLVKTITFGVKAVMATIAIAGKAIVLIGKGIALAVKGVGLIIGGFKAILASAFAPFIAIGAAIAATIYAVYSAFETAMDVFAETGSITRAIATFFIDLITAPLRWLKGLASWVLDFLGFEETAKSLDDFDITKTLVDSVFGLVDDAIEWISGLFDMDIIGGLQRAWTGFMGGAKTLIDIITAPLGKAVEWIEEKFGFELPEISIPGLKDLSDVVIDSVTESVDNVFSWIEEKFGIDPKAALAQVWDEVTDGMGIIGLLTAPIRAAGDWFANKLGFSSPDDEEGVVTQMVRDTWESVKAWLMDMLPSLEDLKGIAKKLNPLNWFGGDEAEEVKKSVGETVDAAVERAGNIAEDLTGIDKQAIEDALKNPVEKVSGFFSSVFGGDEETPEPQVAVEAQTPASPIRDAQMENNALKEEAESKSAVVVAGQGGGSGSTNNTSVNAPTVNMTNSFDLDRVVRFFSFSPSGS